MNIYFSCIFHAVQAVQAKKGNNTKPELDFFLVIN